jgi:hypothetical protein
MPQGEKGRRKEAERDAEIAIRRIGDHMEMAQVRSYSKIKVSALITFA